MADVAVEDVAPGELLLVLGRVELRHRVDDVQLGVGPEPLEHQRRRLTAERADLDDAARARAACSTGQTTRSQNGYM